ncbi:hypothetical protein GIB67_006061 [Kingdonia uniflora]|uniref:glutathione transferase n=1 Tax=Kingdonia uniflora TaxID=39325 RepID=A0A7J7LPS5_9MAGN|nr:hypothetical protein GIB67_006061 [Kingdonia uniflora]
MSTDKVILLDFWVSPFSLRPKIALAEKSVEFEIKEEADLLGNKSDLLLQSNPIYGKVPVLIHKGKPICESTIIVSYIDETWPTPALLPPCAYGKSTARFWADYIDKKLFDAGSKIWMAKGEEAIKVAKKEFIEILKVLEGVLGEKDYCSGESFGFLDIITISLASWFYAFEQYGDFKIEDECPKFSAWMKRCFQRESVAKFVPEPTKVYEFVGMLRKMYGIE